MDKQEFEHVFKSHFKRLHSYAYTIVQRGHEAEEIVQQVFYKLWIKRENLKINESPEAYLYRMVYHDSLNYLEHLKVKNNYKNQIGKNEKVAGATTDGTAIAKELEEKIAEALNLLPEQCRTIFQMSRFQELKYREIADVLHLSVKTVENQMGKALKIMRTQLSEYLPVIIYFILFKIHN